LYISFYLFDFNPFIKKIMINWVNFLSLLENTLKHKHNSVLVVSELDSKICFNKQFWVVTHKRQFNYIEILSQSFDSQQLWTTETPFLASNSGAHTDNIKRSLVQLPSLVIFILGGQVSQFLSIMGFFNKSGIQLVLIQTGRLDSRSLISTIPFYFFLQSETPYFRTKDFVYYLLQVIASKQLTINDKRIEKFNTMFSSQTSFLKLLSRWSSIIGGMQLTKKKVKKRDFFISKNKYNLRLLRKA